MPNYQQSIDTKLFIATLHSEMESKKGECFEERQQMRKLPAKFELLAVPIFRPYELLTSYSMPI